jgi:hypothetical protein
MKQKYKELCVPSYESYGFCDVESCSLLGTNVGSPCI